MPRAIATSLVLLGLTLAPARAIDDGGSYFVRGIGNSLCASYGVARQSHKDTEYQDWLAGYESGFNRWTAGVWNIESAEGFGNSLQWLDYYCSVHPSDSFGIAAQSLIEFLYPGRQRESPSAGLPQGGAGASRPH